VQRSPISMLLLSIVQNHMVCVIVGVLVMCAPLPIMVAGSKGPAEQGSLIFLCGGDSVPTHQPCPRLLPPAFACHHRRP
jgi:hypothetical protein